MITSASNSQVKDIIRYGKKARDRAQAGLFIVEGPKMFGETPEDRLISVYASESFSESEEGTRLLAGKKYELVADNVFAAMSDTQNPQGILALVRREDRSWQDIVNANPRGVFIILEKLQDPGNLGTVIRTAEGAGVNGVLMSADTVDIYNPKVIRSTMGAVYRVPFAVIDDMQDTLRQLHAMGITTCAAYLEGSCEYDMADYTRPTAFIIGNESKGLREDTAMAADVRVRIPMGGKLESLNAAVASAILMYEARRQRK